MYLKENNMSWAVVLIEDDGPFITGCFKNKKTANAVAKVMNGLSLCVENGTYKYYVTRVPDTNNLDTNEALTKLLEGEEWAIRYLKEDKRLCRIPYVVNFLATKESKTNETFVQV